MTVPVRITHNPKSVGDGKGFTLFELAEVDPLFVPMTNDRLVIDPDLAERHSIPTSVLVVTKVEDKRFSTEFGNKEIKVYTIPLPYEHEESEGKPRTQSYIFAGNIVHSTEIGHDRRAQIGDRFRFPGYPELRVSRYNRLYWTKTGPSQIQVWLDT